MSRRSFTFCAAASGPWAVTRQTTLIGEPLPPATHVVVSSEAKPSAGHCAWALRGITSNERYVERRERDALVARQVSLGQAAAICATLIPIRKTAAWWTLTQDERRQIFEDQSQHIRIGMRYLPPIARRLHHCRDVSEHEPFDFLTWFEYEPGSTGLFDQLLLELRASPEWAYIDREVEIRLVKASPEPLHQE